MTDSLPEDKHLATQRAIDAVAKELFELAQHAPMNPKTRDKLRALALRLQPGHRLPELVKFADGTHGCSACGVRADGTGRVTHNQRFPHE